MTVAVPKPRRVPVKDPAVAPKVSPPWVAIHHETLAATLSELNDLRTRDVAARKLERTLRHDVAVAWRDCDLAVMRQTRLTYTAFALAALCLVGLIMALVLK